MTRVSEDGLARALELPRKQMIREEIRQDLEALERYIAEHGDPVAEWNEAFGPPGAASGVPESGAADAPRISIRSGSSG